MAQPPVDASNTPLVVLPVQFEVTSPGGVTSTVHWDAHRGSWSHRLDNDLLKWLTPLARTAGIEKWWDRPFDYDVLHDDFDWAIRLFQAKRPGWTVAIDGVAAELTEPAEDLGDADEEHYGRYILRDGDAVEEAATEVDPECAWVYSAMPARTVDRRLRPVVRKFTREHLDMLGSAEEYGDGEKAVVVVPAMPETEGPALDSIQAVLSTDERVTLRSDWSGAVWIGVSGGGDAANRTVSSVIVEHQHESEPMPVVTAWAMTYWAGQDRLGPWSEQLPVEASSSTPSGDGQIVSVEPNRLRITAPADADRTEQSVELPGVGIYRSSSEGEVLDIDDAIASYGRLRHYIGDAELPAMRMAVRGIVGHGTAQQDLWSQAKRFVQLNLTDPTPEPEEMELWNKYQNWLWGTGEGDT